MSTEKFFIERFLKDYNNQQEKVYEYFGFSKIRQLIKGIAISLRAKKLLFELYENLESCNNHIYLILDKIPKACNRIDLTYFEGSGFYSKVNSYWLYHKGGGSIEALCLQHKLFSDLALQYPAYGAEYPGHYGSFTESSLLGIKALKDCIDEFTTSLTILAYCIDKNSLLLSYKDILGKYTIPLSIVILKELGSILNKNLHLKPNSICKKYKNSSPYFLPAKIVMVVPNKIRGTDNWEIEGKWVETNNVFFRTINSFKCNKHQFSYSPYFKISNTRNRVSAILKMYNAGFIFSPSATHLQNFYVVTPKNSDGFIAADFADFLPIKKFTNSEMLCMIANSINGWRIAESLGPSYCINYDIPCYDQLMYHCSVFFSGLIKNYYRKDICILYQLLPFSTAVAIAKAFLFKSSSNEAINIASKILKEIDFKYRNIKYYHDNRVSRIKNSIKRLYNGLLEQRPKNLINLLHEHIIFGNNRIVSILVTQYSQITILNQNKYDKNQVLLLFNYIVEFLFFLDKDIEYEIKKFLLKYGDKYAINNIFCSLLEEMVSSERLSHSMVKSYITNSIEEICHIKHISLKYLILNSNNISELNIWVKKFMQHADNVIVDSRQFLDDYLAFIFKRKSILSLLENSNTYLKELKVIINEWGNEELPIYRVYPKVKKLKNIKTPIFKESYVNLIKLICNIEVFNHQSEIEL